MIKRSGKEAVDVRIIDVSKPLSGISSSESDTTPTSRLLFRMKTSMFVLVSFNYTDE